MLNIIHGVKDVLGIMQHHDAITGTSAGYVAVNYHKMMDLAIYNNTLVYSNYLIEHFSNYYGLNISNNGKWMQCKK